jgi:hypothetical protein
MGLMDGDARKQWDAGMRAGRLETLELLEAGRRGAEF